MSARSEYIENGGVQIVAKRPPLRIQKSSGRGSRQSSVRYILAIGLMVMTPSLTAPE